MPISDLLLSSSQVLRGTLSTRDHTTHKREGPSSFWTSSYVILSKTFVQKNAGAARGVASRHRRFDDDVGPPSPRWWWWWWFWVRSKTTKRVHHSKVFLDERGNPDDCVEEQNGLCAQRGGERRRIIRRRRRRLCVVAPAGEEHQQQQRGVSTTRNTNNVFFFFVVSSEKKSDFEHVRRKRLRRDRHRLFCGWIQPVFSPRVGGVGERLENAVRERDMENQTIRNGEARFSGGA